MSDLVSRLNAALTGRYRIERKLGEGGMATVYLARDEKHGRNVAVKVLKPELAPVVGAGRFLTEIETTAKLQHPHILPLFDSGEADGFLFYVMPYVVGESLRDLLDRVGRLPVEQAVGIATAVAGALDYAHRQGVIHRDVKPANILLHDGEPLVSDFGIALAVTQGDRLTSTGLSVGTPAYMSPEQASGARDLDARNARRGATGDRGDRHGHDGEAAGRTPNPPGKVTAGSPVLRRYRRPQGPGQILHRPVRHRSRVCRRPGSASGGGGGSV
jgi:serine/threonine-protein kinase